MPTNPPFSQKPEKRREGPPQMPQKRSEAPETDWSEKRSSPRAEVTTEVSFESETNFYVGFTADISTGGLFVVTWDTVPIGTEIMLKFSIPNSSEELRIKGTVRWVREHNPTNPDLWPGMGVQFQDLTQREVAAIESFVRQREPLFYE